MAIAVIATDDARSSFQRMARTLCRAGCIRSSFSPPSPPSSTSPMASWPSETELNCSDAGRVRVCSPFVEVSTDWTSPRSFVLREENVKVIWALLKDRIGDMSASARCADEMKREFRDLKELLGYENLPGRRILRLELDARFYQSGKSKSASVRFDQSGVDVRLGGPEDVITRLTTDLKDFLVGIRGRFDRLARFDFVNLCFLLYLVGVVTLFSMFVAGYFGLTLQ